MTERPTAPRGEGGPPGREPLADLLAATRTVGGAGDRLGAGSVAGTVVALAAALVETGCRHPRAGWAEAAATAAQASALRRRALRLAELDADAFAEAVDTLATRDELPPHLRDARLGDALHRAAEAPLLLAEVAADVAQLAAWVWREVRDDVRPDVAGSATLAAGAAHTAAHLVEVNLGATPADPRTALARQHVRLADEAAAHVHAQGRR